MDMKELYSVLLKIGRPLDDSYNVIKHKDCYFGVTREGYILFATESKNKKIRSISQQTKKLFLGTNMLCKMGNNENQRIEHFDVLMCQDLEVSSVSAFLHLALVYADEDIDSSIEIKDLFDSLKNMFANKQKLPMIELQGLFAELYFIDVVQKEIPSIAQFWQSIDKMKFDFSFTESRKIEIKSSTNDSRIHKFRHEQLVSDIYETWVVSVLLRKDDKGLSLYELVERIKNNHSSNLKIHSKLAGLLFNYSNDELDSIRFNEQYIQKNLGFYKTDDIPKFPDKQPRGVFNTEYDSDLSGLGSRTFSELCDWIRYSL